MTAHSLLDELEGVVRLMDAASFVDLDWGWRRDDDDTPGSIFTHSFGGMHQAVAMCPRYGKDSFAADASYIVALHNFLRTHHATLADMAKRLEAAERDAARYRWLRGGDSRLAVCDEDTSYYLEQLDAIVDAAAQEGEG